MTDAKKMTREEYNLEMGAFCVCPKELLMEAHVQEGRNYSVKVLIGTPENIACFLMKNAAAREIVITDLLDRPVVTAFGCFLDRCRDDALRNSILSYLLPMQQGEKPVKDVFTPAREQFEAWYAEHPEHQFVGKPANAAVTEKMIRRGLAKGIVKIIDSPHDGEPACQMGDYWFYFAGMEGAGESAEEYLAHSDIDDVIREITDAVNSLDETERGYYASLLNEAGITEAATYDDLSMSEANAKIRTQFGPDAPTLCAYLEDDDTIRYRYYHDGIEKTWNGYSSVGEAYAGLKEQLTMY